MHVYVSLGIFLGINHHGNYLLIICLHKNCQLLAGRGRVLFNFVSSEINTKPDTF